ncbi:hypothetical protein [Spongiactinospora sp. TRM90649]|uniref:hypothetical protein n=1 Tax=Spongiactinospora sp. TRM90649 TaxID=3031114 RepID=UPI0023F657A5|nr:hypothetical protein [Spongiactinospora sp. TRM90649]MDF5756650.1 hypothetical protein [Spongiactinospora sp. TRM90649]
MAWRVDSRTVAGRWVAYDGSDWTSDADTWPDMIVGLAQPQPLTPTGPYYTPAGPDDEVAIFLRAVRVIAAPVVTGDPPQVPQPEPPGETPGDTLY